jgi:hypothetical protein
VRTEARQCGRLRILRSVADIGRKYAGDGRVKEGIWDVLPHCVAEVQRLALAAAERDLANAVLRRAHAELPHELGQVVGCNDVASSDLSGQHKEAHVSERTVEIRGVGSTRRVGAE